MSSDPRGDDKYSLFRELKVVDRFVTLPEWDSLAPSVYSCMPPILLNHPWSILSTTPPLAFAIRIACPSSIPYDQSQCCFVPDVLVSSLSCPNWISKVARRVTVLDSTLHSVSRLFTVLTEVARHSSLEKSKLRCLQR